MTESLDSLLPLQPTTFHILLSLTDDAAQAVKLVLDCYERRCAHVDDPHEPHKADAQ